MSIPHPRTEVYEKKLREIRAEKGAATKVRTMRLRNDTWDWYTDKGRQYGNLTTTQMVRLVLEAYKAGKLRGTILDPHEDGEP